MPEIYIIERRVEGCGDYWEVAGYVESIAEAKDIIAKTNVYPKYPTLSFMAFHRYREINPYKDD